MEAVFSGPCMSSQAVRCGDWFLALAPSVAGHAGHAVAEGRPGSCFRTGQCRFANLGQFISGSEQNYFCTFGPM